MVYVFIVRTLVMDKGKKAKEKEIHDRLGCTPATSDCIKVGTFIDMFKCRVCSKIWRG